MNFDLSLKSRVKEIVSDLLSGPLYSLMCFMFRNKQAHDKLCSVKLNEISQRPTDMYQPIVMGSEITVDISIIIPVYNVERYLRDCLDSLVEQDLNGTFEVIVVDDGSTDSSGDIAESYSCLSNFTVIHQANGGLSAARNAGLRVANGAYIMFIDSDDKIAPGYIDAMKCQLDKSGADYVTSTFRYMSDEGVVGDIEPKRTDWMAPWGRLYRRSVWNNLSFPVGSWYEDLIHPLCIDPRFEEKPCYELAGYMYRIRPGSIMQSTPTNVKGLDSYWVLDELLSWRIPLGFSYSQQDYDSILPLFGPLLLGRTIALNNSSRRMLFCAASKTFCSVEEFETIKTSLPGAWSDIEISLRDSNYKLYLLASLRLAAAGDVGLSLKDAVKIFANRNR